MISRTKKWFLFLVILLLLGLVFIAYRYSQGPVVPAYQLSKRPLVQYVVATGRVVSLSRFQVGSEITGVVTERLVKEGDKIKAGDVLIRLQPDEFAAKVQEARAALEQLQEARRPQVVAGLQQAEALLNQKQREVNRRQKLLSENAISREQKEQADQDLAAALAGAKQARLELSALQTGQSEEALILARLAAAESALSKTVLRSKFSGTVLIRQVEPGDLVQPGKTLLEIARDTGTEVLVPVDERNLGVLATEQKAICIPDAYPYQSFSASVYQIAPTVDPQRGTVDVRLEISNAPDYLRDDMTVTANIETGRRDQALVVPNDALFNRKGQQASVWRIRAGKTEQVDITLGLEGVAMTEVIENLQEGDWIATVTDLSAGQSVRLTASLFQPTKQTDETSKEVPFKF